MTTWTDFDGEERDTLGSVFTDLHGDDFLVEPAWWTDGRRIVYVDELRPFELDEARKIAAAINAAVHFLETSMVVIPGGAA